MADCPICLKEIRTNKSKTILKSEYITTCQCNYYYHLKCISKWLKIKKICPICKRYIYNNPCDKLISIIINSNDYILNIYEYRINRYFQDSIIIYGKFFFLMIEPLSTIFIIFLYTLIVIFILLKLDEIVEFFILQL